MRIQKTSNIKRTFSKITSGAAIFSMIIQMFAVAMPAYADNSGLSSPSANTNSGWFHPEYAYTSNIASAIADNKDDVVIYKNFNIMAIPVGSTIDGIEVSVKGYTSGTSRQADISLGYDNTTNFTTGIGTGVKTTSLPNNFWNETTKIYGGASDAWGKLWSPSDFTNANFAIKLDATSSVLSLLSINQILVRVYYTPDTSAPTVPSNLSPSDNSFVTTAFLDEISWSASQDQNGPIAYIYQSSLSNVTNPDGSFTSPAYTSGWQDSTSINTSGTPKGVYYWHVKAKDSIGNESTWSSAWKITVDNTNPAASIDFNLGTGPTAKGFNAIFNEPVKITEATNPANYFLNNWPDAGGSGSLTGHATITYDELTNTATVLFTDSGWYVSPEQQWGVENIHDLAGNLISTSPLTKYSTPMTAPVTTLSLVGTLGLNGYYTSDVTVNLSADDSDSAVGSGVKNTYYSIDGSSYVSGKSFVVNADGAHEVKYYSTDNAGNTETIKTTSFNIDKTAPIITIDGDIVTSLTYGDTYIDAGAKATDNNDGDLTSKITTVSNIDLLNAGNYTVTYSVTDTAGNTSTAVRSVIISPLKITITAEAKTKVFGATDPALTYTITSKLSIDPSQITGNLTRVPGETVGSYLINSTISLGDNFAVTFIPSTLTITAAPVVTTGNVLGTTAVATTSNTEMTETEGTGEVLGAEIAATDTESDTSATDKSDTKKSETNFFIQTMLGIYNWIWLLALAAIIAGGWWIIAARRRKDDEEK